MADPSTRARLVPLTGLLFVVLTVASFAIGGEPPDADAPPGEVVEYWVDHDDQAMIGSLVEAMAAMSLVFFAATLHRALREVRPGSSPLSVAAFGGGVIAAAGVGVDASLRFAAGDIAGDVPPEVLQTINALWSDFFFPMVIGMATLVLAASLAALLAKELLPAWLAWIGVLIVVVLFTPIGFIGFLAGGVWIAVLSVMLSQRAAAGSTA